MDSDNIVIGELRDLLVVYFYRSTAEKVWRLDHRTLYCGACQTLKKVKGSSSPLPQYRCGYRPIVCSNTQLCMMPKTLVTLPLKDEWWGDYREIYESAFTYPRPEYGVLSRLQYLLQDRLKGNDNTIISYLEMLEVVSDVFKSCLR